MASKVILVTGATGKQGGGVIDALLAQKEQQWEILAVTRTASSSSAQKLAAKSPSIKLVEGNLDDVPALFAEAKKVASGPIWGVYSVQVSQGKGVTHDGEIAQGKALIDQSLENGVKHFVYSSVDRGGNEVSWDVETPIPHFQTKYHLERYLREKTEGTSLGWTILRPVAFMDNWEPGFPSRVFLAALKNNLGDKSMQWVATSDIGVFAAIAFANPAEYNHKALGIAGDRKSVAEITQTFKEAVDYDHQPAPWFLGSVLTTLVKEVGLMVGWFGSDGYGVDIAEVKKIHPGTKDLATWLKTESKYKK